MNEHDFNEAFTQLEKMLFEKFTSSRVHVYWNIDKEKLREKLNKNPLTYNEDFNWWWNDSTINIANELITENIISVSSVYDSEK